MFLNWAEEDEGVFTDVRVNRRAQDEKEREKDDREQSKVVDLSRKKRGGILKGRAQSGTGEEVRRAREGGKSRTA